MNVPVHLNKVKHFASKPCWKWNFYAACCC